MQLLVVMSFTAEEKAYHLRKMWTHFTRLDINKDGYISRKDYEEIAQKVAEYGKLSQEEAATTMSAFLEIADILDLKPGLKLTIEEASQKVHKNTLCLPSDQNKDICDRMYGMMFDAFDTNKDSHISVEERFVGVFFKILAPDIKEEDVKRSFRVLDANNDGEISRDEFLTAAFDFMCGMKETEVANSLFGQLL